MLEQNVTLHFLFIPQVEVVFWKLNLVVLADFSLLLRIPISMKYFPFNDVTALRTLRTAFLTSMMWTQADSTGTEIWHVAISKYSLIFCESPSTIDDANLLNQMERWPPGETRQTYLLIELIQKIGFWQKQCLWRYWSVIMTKKKKLYDGTGKW